MGKSSSKLKKRRSQSIAWSFRFSTLSKRMAPVEVTSYPHLDIRDWLTRLDLENYIDNFIGYTGVEDIITFTEHDIKKHGVRNSAHRARIISSLVALRAKSEKENITKINCGNFRRTPRKPLSPHARQSVQEQSTNYEPLTVTPTKQSKSLGDLFDMESPSPDASEAIALKKALEWELSLDSRDLRSHAWYHGPIPRQRSEEIVQTEGDFLIRDCTSQPGSYVLTCKTKTSTLHFVINKILLQQDTVYEREQFQFEDDAYDTVADLITYYVGSGKPISAASGARIQTPCNRMYPLSFYASKYGSHMAIHGQSPINSPSPTPSGGSGVRYNPYTQQHNGSSYRSPMSSPPRTKRETPPRLPSKKRSQSLTPLQQTQNSQKLPAHLQQEKYCSADGVIAEKHGEATNKPPLNLKDLKVLEARRLHSTQLTHANKNGDDVPTPTNGGAPMTRSIEEQSTSADGVIKQNGKSMTMSRSIGESSAALRFSTQSLPRFTSNGARPPLSSRTSSLNRDNSDQSLSPCLEDQKNGGDGSKTPSPPPKPSRYPTLRSEAGSRDQDAPGPVQRVASYHASGSDSGNGSGDSVQSSNAGEDHIQPRGVIIKNPRFIPNSASSMTLRNYESIDPVAAEAALLAMNILEYPSISKFDFENFNTLLLPYGDFKPLDGGTLHAFRLMLCETGARVIANHLTRVDIGLILGGENEPKLLEEDPLACTGIELITLDHGKQFRQDLIERTECLKLLVAVTILTCPSDDERAETLNKWIQIAIDTKTALGNLFGFCCVMLGLCMPQIQQLSSTWHLLRQKYTDSAFNFEAKLRPTLKNMNDCANPQAPNTTVPHLLPYALLKDRSIDDILGMIPTESTLVSTCITPWETSAQDFGFSIMFAHLDSARGFINNLPLYRKNAQIVLSDTSRLDALLEDAFRTEFHVNFLWGKKGAMVTAEERHAKFEQVLTVMAEKFCAESA